MPWALLARDCQLRLDRSPADVDSIVVAGALITIAIYQYCIRTSAFDPAPTKKEKTAIEKKKNRGQTREQKIKSLSERLLGKLVWIQFEESNEK